MVVDLSGAKEFGGGSGRIGDWLRPRCLSPILLDPLSSTAGDPEEPNEFELNSIRNDPRKLETIRLRLSDLRWWMRVLCQYIAVRANREDNELGKFWQSRFRAVRLLDEAALLACATYVWRNGDGTSHDVLFQWFFIVGRSQSPFFNRLLSQRDYLELLDWTARRVAPASEERLRRRRLRFSAIER